MMIPDCHRRLGAAHTELKNILETEVRFGKKSFSNVTVYLFQVELAETEEYEAAKTQIAEAEEQLKVE